MAELGSSNTKLHTAQQLLNFTILRSDIIGLTKSTLLPSLGVHGGLSLIAYGIARATDRVELKDYLWPTGMIFNAWWAAIGRHMATTPHVTFSQAWSRLSYNQIALLGAATAWSARLTYRIVSRSLRRGSDDPRYETVKTEPGFWNKAPFAIFVPEAVFQALITLPLVLPMKHDSISGMYGAPTAWAGWVRLLACGLFATGLTMETLADGQLDSYKNRANEQGRGKILSSGVWSVVRHPNYLGDALCHFAFPLWNLGSGMFSPWQILGPIANYFFLRGIGGDKQNEEYQQERYAKEDKTKYAEFQEYRAQKNSFWPGVSEITNPWTLICIGSGVAAAGTQYMFEGNF